MNVTTIVLIPGDGIGPEVSGATRRDQLLSQIDKIQPTGDTGLYDTAAAAQACGEQATG